MSVPMHRFDRAVTTTIHLVRHGQTALNAQGRFRGRQNLPLDDSGFAQAAEVAQRLAGAGIEVVYTSPLLRCVQTAECIASAADVDVVTMEDLVDADHGSWQGLTPEEAERRDPETYAVFRAHPNEACMPSGESLANVRRRTLAALGRIGQAHNGSAAAAVSHEIPIRLVVAHLAAIDGAAIWDLDLPTCSVTRLRFDDGALSLGSDAPA
jgi:probable phosphoglycerate mutase